MAIKAVNNIVGFDGLVPNLLVFGVYLYIYSMDPSAPTIIQRVIAIEKTIE